MNDDKQREKARKVFDVIMVYAMRVGAGDHQTMQLAVNTATIAAIGEALKIDCVGAAQELAKLHDAWSLSEVPPEQRDVCKREGERMCREAIEDVEAGTAFAD